MLTTRSLLAMCAGAVLCCSPAAFAQVSDEAIDAAVASFYEKVNNFEPEGDSFPFDVYDKMAKEAMEGIALEDLSTEQMATLSQTGLLTMAYDSDEVMAVVKERAKGDAPGSGNAALMLASMTLQEKGQIPGSEKEIAEVMTAYFEHPRADEGLADGGIMSMLSAFEYLEYLPALRAAMDDISAPMLAFIERCVATDDPESASALPYMIEGLAYAGVPESKVLELKSAAERKVTMMLADASISDEQRTMLKAAESRFTRAEREAALVGNAMPEMDIVWSSNPEVESFEDYRGKVLIIDFWATWCGPCVASFPNVRELVEKYDGYDVAVVGVTSVQGTHYPQGGNPVDVEGDTQREFELMAQYMEKNEVTWDVVFTEQDVFNADYIVEGIPHVVIVDAEGVLRHRGLHPMDEDKPAKINALLTEAGKKTPEG